MNLGCVPFLERILVDIHLPMVEVDTHRCGVARHWHHAEHSWVGFSCICGVVPTLTAASPTDVRDVIDDFSKIDKPSFVYTAFVSLGLIRDLLSCSVVCWALHKLTKTVLARERCSLRRRAAEISTQHSGELQVSGGFHIVVAACRPSTD